MLTLLLVECQGGSYFKTDLNDELVKFAMNELLDMFKVRLRAKWGQDVRIVSANYAEVTTSLLLDYTDSTYIDQLI